MTVRAALAAAAQRLSTCSETARLDAELLMAHSLGLSREALLLGHLDDEAPPQFDALAERRSRGEPVAYITGRKGFWTLDLKVTPDVLISRADSETLIEAAIARLPRGSAPRILDLGTGSGALLLAALSEWPLAWGLGVDRSEAAIRVARENAALSGLSDRAAFIVGDWAAALSGPFDLIFCNPPYIASEAELPRDVADFEPATALYAGPDGLDDYRRILPEIERLLAPEGLGCIEIGYDQAEAVSGLARAAGLEVSVVQDLAGRDRCLVLRRL